MNAEDGNTSRKMVSNLGISFAFNTLDAKDHNTCHSSGHPRSNYGAPAPGEALICQRVLGSQLIISTIIDEALTSHHEGE